MHDSLLALIANEQVWLKKNPKMQKQTKATVLFSLVPTATFVSRPAAVSPSSSKVTHKKHKNIKPDLGT